MASSGTISNTFRTGYAIRITWQVTSQSTANNTSTVTANVQLVSLGSSYTIVSSATKYGSLTVNGTTYDFSFNAGLSGNQAKTIFTKTGIVIPHNSDGTKTCAFSCSAGIKVTLGSTYWNTVSASGVATFNNIARASSISSVTASTVVNGTNAVTVNISRASSSFKHKVVFKFGSYTYTVTNVDTSTSYVVPMEWLNAIPNSTTGSGTVTIETYSGSTKIGASDYKSFQLVVPDTVKPTISSIGITEGTEGIASQFNGFVQNKSKFVVSILASGAYSSTIKSYKTTIQGVSYNGSSFTSETVTSSGTINFIFTVTDSRGRTYSDSRSRTVIPYAPPSISRFSVYRSNSSGSQVYEGCCVSASIKFDISSINNLNAKSYLIEYKLKSSSTWSTLASGNVYSYDDVMVFHEILTVDNSYNLRLTISDYFTTATAVQDIPTAFTLIDFHSGGKGMAVGKVSEKANALEIAMDIYDKNGTLFRNGLAYYQASGSTDVNTTLEELVLSSTNTPIQGAFFYVRTMFFSSKSETSNRTQMAYPYSSMQSAYYRYYSNGTWSEWVEQPVIVEKGTSGIWTYRKYSDGTAECFGKIDVTLNDVNVALGGWYRGANLYEATTYPYPVAFSSAPSLSMMFQTRNSSAALLWTFSSSAENAKSYLPQCYLIRPVTGTGINGHINIIAKGNY